MFIGKLKDTLSKLRKANNKQKPTLIDNIYVNLFNIELKSGSLVEKISDLLPNFIIITNINKKISKHKIKVRDLHSCNKD